MLRWSERATRMIHARAAGSAAGAKPSGHTRMLAACAAGALTCAVVLAQQQPPPPDSQEQRPTFRVGANLVRVDVSVIDRHGEPVTTLQQNDFDVFEDGAPQTIQTFKLIESDGDAPDDFSLPIRSQEHARAEAARDEIRVFVIFWDEYHIGQMVPAIEGRRALADFVHNAFGPADLVAIMDPLTPLDAIRFTRDRLELTETVRKLTGRLGIYMPPRSPLEEGQMMRVRNIEQLRAQVTTSAIDAAIAHLGAIREGRKSLLIVSQDIGALPRDERYRWMSDAVRLANTNNTAIYTMDPRGLTVGGRMSDVLQALASDTGGRWFMNNAPARELRRMVKDARAFYLLGYASTLNPADGRFHRIKVQVKRPGVETHARSGYFAPAPTQIVNARTQAAAAVVPPDVTRALTALATIRPDSLGDLWVGATRGAEGRPRVTVAWTAADGQNAAAVRVRATAADGTVYFDGDVPRESASFSAAPGALTIQRTVLDSTGAAADRQSSTFQVPDFASGALTISSPVLLRARNALERRSLAAADDAPPYAGQVFARGDRLMLRFSVFGAAASSAIVTVNLLSRKGVALAALPFARRGAREGDYEVQLPVASIAQGDYMLAVEATHGDARTKALVPFRAVP